MSKRSGVGFGGFLIGLGLTWYILRYLEPNIAIGPYLLIVAGIAIVSAGLLRRMNREYGELASGLMGGIVLAVIFSSISGGNVVFPFGTEVVGSSSLTTKEYDFQVYSKVVVSNGFTVELSSGDSHTVTVTVNDNLVNYLNIRQDGDTLRIGLKRGSYSNTRLQAVVITPSLSELTLSDGSNAEALGFESSDFNLRLSDGSEATLSGSAVNVDVVASDGSRAYLSGFKANDAHVTFSDGSHGSVYADGVLDVDLSDGSHLDYYGDPTLGDIHLYGGSTITPK